ncbi:hypothetical protein RRG08_017652 [Elysia crispata]|uniref:Uncharacterized protein n=1 Tax=Elysia crispata TaxID=231223 RepID=A0AAE0ZCK5_9GAST|nr:hypothetical protein RRG08_017652 [Elysia crispata]
MATAHLVLTRPYPSSLGTIGVQLLHQARDVLEKASAITSHRFSNRVHATEELNQVAEALDTTPISFYLSLGIELSYDKDYLEKHLARKLMTS